MSAVSTFTNSNKAVAISAAIQQQLVIPLSCRIKCLNHMIESKPESPANHNLPDRLAVQYASRFEMQNLASRGVVRSVWRGQASGLRVQECCLADFCAVGRGA